MTKLIPLSLLLFTHISSPAQGFKAGVITGISVTQVDGDNYSGFNKSGLVAGGFVNRSFTNVLSLQMEIHYTGKGSRKLANPEHNDFRMYRVTLHYIDVPLILKINHEKYRMIYDVGVSYGRLFRSREEDESGDIVLLSPFYNNEISTLLGFSFSITEQLFINLRYVRSLFPITDRFIIQSWGIYGGSFNSVVELTLRYQFK